MKIPEKNRIRNVNTFHSLPFVETSELCVVMSQKIVLYKCLIFTVSARGDIFFVQTYTFIPLGSIAFCEFCPINCYNSINLKRNVAMYLENCFYWLPLSFASHVQIDKLTVELNCFC